MLRVADKKTCSFDVKCHIRADFDESHAGS
jgi:hypothetical protein